MTQPMHQETQHSGIKIVIDWIAAILGIGTFAGLVNVVVGILSGIWIARQLWVSFKYDLPIKKAKLKAAKAGQPFTTPGDLS